MPQQQRANTCWHYLATVLVSTWTAFATIFLFRNAVIYSNSEYVNLVTTHCNAAADAQRGITGGDGEYVCHYLNLWKRISSNAAAVDKRCFVQTFLLAAIIASAHYVAASMLLLFAGVVRHKYIAFVPWLVTKMMLFLLLATLTVSEVSLLDFGGSEWGVGVSQVFVASACLSALALLSWVVVFTTCMKIKQSCIDEEMLKQKQIRFQYYRM
jgi:hypothetical protein